MNRKVIDKNLIESIVRKDNDEFVDNVTEKLNNIVANAVNDLSRQIAYINVNNVFLQPVNELLTGGFTDNSKFVYFLGIDSAQLELNTLNSTNLWRNIKNTVKNAWFAGRKRRKKRKKKDKQQDDKVEIYDFDPAKYNIYSLCEDLQTAIAKYSALTTIVYLEDTRIRIVGKDDYGSNTQIIIYPTIYNGQVYKYYLGKRKGFVEIDINQRIALLTQKIDRVGQNFVDMIKIFNVLYFYANKSTPNQIFIESLLYSCPDELFKGKSVYNQFVKIINYLTMSSIKEIPSLTNQNKTIFTDKTSSSSGIGYEKFINQFVYLDGNKENKKDDKKVKNNKNK